METSEGSLDRSSHQIDIQTELSKQLDKLRQQSPERLPTPVHVLAAVNGSIDGQLEERLLEVSGQDPGKRITVVPYDVGNAHWIGILIEFDSDELIERSEFIDPVKGSDFVPEKLQQGFTRVFPNYMLRPKTGIKLEDRTKSAKLTISNLLSAVQKSEMDDNSLMNSQTNKNSNSYPSNKEQQNLHGDSSDSSTHFSTAPVQGNAPTVQELQMQLRTGLESLRISNEKMLPERIRRVRERIQECQAAGETDNAEREITYLKRYEELQKLAEKIERMRSDISVLNDSHDLELQQLEAKLTASLAKLKIPDVTSLANRVLRSEQRVREYREEDRIEDLEKEQKYLSECQTLQKLVEEIRQMKINQSGFRLSMLERKLASELAKLKISDVALLSDRIRRSEQRIKEYEQEDRSEDVQREEKHVNEYRILQKLAEEIRELKIEQSESRLPLLEQKLADGLAKLKISDMKLLLDKILRLEQRIKEYQDEDRTDDAQKEANYLSELNKLRVLNDEISALKTAPSNTSESNAPKAQELEKTITSSTAKLKISDVSLLPDKILRSEQRINEFRDEDRVKEAEAEELYLKELKSLKALIDKTAVLKTTSSDVSSDKASDSHELENQLNQNFARLKIRDVTQLPVRIERSKERIQQYEDEENTDAVEREKILLDELGELQKLSEKLSSLKSTPTLPPPEPNLSVLAPPTLETTVAISALPSPNASYLDELREDLATMPSCAEKSTLELLVQFEQKLLNSKTHTHDSESVALLLQTLQDQIKKQEWFSEKVRANLCDISRYIDNQDIQLTVHSLRKLLNSIRPLNIREIERLVQKAKRAGELIVGKEIILLVGETGTGKSTTIHFLAGSKMKKIRVEIGPGDFLEHITPEEPIKNPALRNITCSARSKSETRYIAPVTIPLKDIFGPSGHGEIILCDAPGFGDTAGPEVDIANGVGICEAIKGSESVKILVLSSLKGLGDRGTGIQKLIHLLISMIHNVQDRLSSILYAFTKYPPNSNISALLLDIKQTTVEPNPMLQSNTAFVAVLADMIEKARAGAEIIDPLQGHPMTAIQKLRNLQGIMFPREVFRFSISDETQGCILNQTQRDNSSVRCALKHKDIDLAMYYLDQLKTLKDLLEHSPARDAYEDATRSVSDSITTYCAEVTKKFNRALVSQDGLQHDDIEEYKNAIDYVQKVQRLATHLPSNLLSPVSLMQNIYSELKKRNQALINEDSHSSLIGVYFNNLLLLKNSFEQFDSFYNETCEKFKLRFEELVESANELISANEYKKIAELILKVSKCVPILNQHLHGLVEQNYRSIVQSLLRHLENLSEQVDSVLARIRVTENDVEIIQDCVRKLRTARENSALQDRITVYVEMLTKQNDKLPEDFRNITQIYNASIEKIVDYFNRISDQIFKLYESNQDRALEDTEALINDMDTIRKVPEIESRTAGRYYRIVGDIRNHMHQLQREVEQLLIQIDSNSGTPNYGKIARILSRLKNAKWMNRVSPGAYDVSINRITEELVDYFHQLEDNLKKLDLSLKYPENICKAQEIFDQMESLSVLERSIPQLKNSKDEAVQRFLEAVQTNFDRIRTKFNLQEKDISENQQKLDELEKIKQEFDNLHPAHVFLRQQNFSNINELHRTIDDLENKPGKGFETNDEYSSLTQVHQNNPEDGQEKDKYSNSISQLKSVRRQYADLMAKYMDNSSEQISFLRSKGYQRAELLSKAIANEKKEIGERQKNPSYDLSGTFAASTADTALLYTTNCEKIPIDSVKKTVADTREILLEYINEYGRFLDKKIDRLFRNLTTPSPKQDLSQNSQDLEACLEQLSSLKKFPRVFDCINGTEKTEQWRRKFARQYQNMHDLMEECKSAGNNDQLRELLTIACGLMSADYFYADSSLSDGFGALYRKHQLEAINQCKAAYQEVIVKIQEENFPDTENALIDVDETKANVREINMIKQALRSSLDSLMKRTRKSVNNFNFKDDFKETNERVIQKISDNIEKVHIVLTKPTIMKFLDAKTTSDLGTFEEVIKNGLLTLLLNELRSIEHFMKTDDILEAEQTMEIFLLVQREIANHFTFDSITEQLNRIRKALDSLANEIEKKYDFRNIEKYPVYSPRNILDKLQKAIDSRRMKYERVHKAMLSGIRSSFDAAIARVSDASIEQRPLQMAVLQSMLQYLPDDLGRSFEGPVADLKRKFEEEEQRYKRDLKEYLENEHVDDSTIRRISQVAAEYREQNREEPLHILRSDITRRLEDHWRKIQNASDKDDAQPPIQSMKEIIRYGQHALNILEVKQYCERVCNSIMASIKKYTEALHDILKIEKSESVELAFDNLIVYLELCQDFPTEIEKLLSKKVFSNLENRLKTVYESWQHISDAYEISLSDHNIKNLHEAMNTTKQWDSFLQKVRNCRCSYRAIQEFVNSMTNITLYSEMKADLMKRITQLAKQLDVKLMTDETTRFEKERDKLFSNIANALQTLKMIRSEFENDLLSNVDIENSEQALKKKVEEIKEKLLTSTSKDEWSLIESDAFRMCYNHLVSFEKYIHLPEVNISRTLELVENKILEKVRNLSKEIDKSGSSVEKIAELLTKIKFFAENFSMFDSKINAVIDEVLKAYKAQGSIVLGQLTMVLESTDIGSRIIAEHSSLSGEDWRKRRERMQNQDNLDIILAQLEGDDIAVDKLNVRYKTFRQVYDELLSNLLKSFDPKTSAEPNITGLISRTKTLFDRITNKSGRITWNSTFPDKLPEIVAHIFAVWTLKNTQHYNTMRGIEAGKSYLLMPHVGQVIAVFRILCIGYRKLSTETEYETTLPQKISKDLVNNLVQIGTGEGKSVVMAIVACVFALMGMNVNCSCYSEYLSTRDKNDFASVFQALGIEDHIEYGTFNKLCENVLNEQCNIREKVRDMIMNNAETIEVARSTTRARPKVLLIDEVDVFLSEKFYGGMYAPSVHLKDPSIKDLLDVLWKNGNNLHTLNAIKALPEYKNCATRFSNWVSVLEEAIKDMVVALQAFRASSYTVQNDKIVYVEGESFVENVVRGYDTIWAYYYENQKGFISQTSLETNVGIILNCGTFSYAQVPTEYSFIAGVSGTLKTLAEQEKKILHNVYHISKSTYMPSVFGKSNRNYNPINDVQAVGQEEYFMKIRGEIDAICNARRAILVFFECEETLLVFYNSPELSLIKESVQIITERVSAKERELCIKRAATEGRVTLLTRTFGRGTDFICRNPNLLANGGIHVLQTFFSEERSEEYQIMGRSARQGDQGSYRMILLENDLEWVLGVDWEQKIQAIKGSTLYSALDDARTKIYEGKCESKRVGVEQRKHEHHVSRNFMKALIEKTVESVKTFLIEQNRGPNIAIEPSRTLLLMDATGSMAPLLSAAKDTVCTMFQRTSDILKEKGLPTDVFQMQFVVYRDYDCKDELLQSSSWETKPNNLRSFIENMEAKGGGDYAEAIEIGLWYAVDQSKMLGDISQVILIGDAPAKEKEAISKDRRKFGGESYWSKTKYGTETYYKDEVRNLQEKKIPVHAYYLHEGAKNNFEYIAKETRGRCEFLNIQSSVGAESLTAFVTEEVLRKTAGDQGEAAVKLYRERYGRKTYIS